MFSKFRLLKYRGITSKLYSCMMRIQVVIVLLIIFYAIDAKSDCPDPAENERFVTVWVGGCEYEVQVCFKCVGTTPSGHINVFGFRKVDLNCNQSLNTSEVFESICNQVYEYNYIKQFICLSEQIVPCEPWDEGIGYNFYHEICWMKKKQPDGTIEYSTCNLANTYCFENWKICFDPTLPPPSIRYTLLYGPYISGQYEELCEGVNEPPDPTLPGIYSTCFELHTPCNP